MARDPYNPTPSVAPTVSAPQDYATVRANPNQFGAQGAQAVQKLGATGQDIANQFTRTQLQYQGMINETLATDAETQAASEYGRILGEYKSKEGLEAVQALPGTVKQLQEVRQRLGAALPNPAAKRAFDLLATRREGYALQDVNLYGATQVKAADIKSANAAVANAIDSASDPSVASNDQQFNGDLANVKFQVARVVTNMGYGANTGTGMAQDPTTGDITFDESSENGKKAKEVYDNIYNTAVGKIWENRIKAIAFDPAIGNPTAAYKMLQENRDKIPADVRARIVATLAAPLKNESARNSANDAIAQADANYQTHIGNATDQTSDYNIKGVSTIVSSVVPGATITSTLRSEEENKRVHGVSNSGHLVGKALDFVPPAGMSLEEAAAKIREANPRLKVLVEGPVAKNSTNPHIHVEWGSAGPSRVNGYVSKADYYREHYDEIVSAAGEAEARRPNSDATTIDLAKQRTEQKINDVIRAQEMQNKAQQNTVLSYVTGKTGTPTITDMSQLENAPQPIRDAWHQMNVDNPLGAAGIEKIVAANSHGTQNTYGTNGFQYLFKVLDGELDQPGLMNSVGKDKNSPLTNSGYAALNNELEFMHKDPGAREFARRELQFLQSVYNNANPAAIMGQSSPVLDDKAQKQLPTLLNYIQQKRKEGKDVNQIFSPTLGGKPNPDYAGNQITLPTNDEIWKERQRMLDNKMTMQQNKVFELSQHPEKIQTIEELQSMIKAGAIKTPEEAQRIIDSNPNLRKYVKTHPQDNAPKVPIGIE